MLTHISNGSSPLLVLTNISNGSSPLLVLTPLEISNGHIPHTHGVNGVCDLQEARQVMALHHGLREVEHLLDADVPQAQVRLAVHPHCVAFLLCTPVLHPCCALLLCTPSVHFCVEFLLRRAPGVSGAPLTAPRGQVKVASLRPLVQALTHDMEQRQLPHTRQAKPTLPPQPQEQEQKRKEEQQDGAAAEAAVADAAAADAVGVTTAGKGTAVAAAGAAGSTGGAGEQRR